MTETADYARAGVLEAHKTTHQYKGSDEISVLALSGLLADDQHVLDAEVKLIKLDDFASPDDNPDLNASPAKHGLLPKLSDIVTQYLNGQGSFSTPPDTTFPDAHNAMHQSGGAGEINVGALAGVLSEDQHVLDAEVKLIKLDDFASPDDNTDLNASTAKHGLLRKLSNVVTEFLNGQGGFSVPAGGNGAVLPSNYISGFVLSNDADTEHDINVTAGKARDSTDAENIVLASEITKQIDAVWSVGNDAGGMDTGSVGASTLYAVWLIKRSDTDVEDALFSLSFTAPSMPANYDYKRLLGYVLTDGSSNIIAFTQQGDGREVCIWQKVRLQIATGLASTSYATQSLASVLPSSMVLMFLPGGIGAATFAVYISTDGTNASIIFGVSNITSNIGQVHELYHTDSASPIFVPVISGSIYYKVSTSSMTLFLRAAIIQR